MFGDKRGASYKIILVSVIGVLLVIIIATIIYFWTTRGQTPVETIKQAVRDVGTLITGEEYDEGEQREIEYLERVTGSSSGGGGGGSSSSSSGGGSSSSGSSSGGTSCTNQLIPYGLLNLEKKSECNVWDEGICVDKTANCSIQLHNYDQSSVGYFTMKASFIPKGGNESTDIFDVAQDSFEVAPNSFETFFAQTHITSTGINGLANKDIDCLTNTVGNPYKIVC